MRGLIKIFSMVALFMLPIEDVEGSSFRYGNNIDFGRIVVEYSGSVNVAWDEEGNRLLFEASEPFVPETVANIKPIREWVTSIRTIEPNLVAFVLNGDVTFETKKWKQGQTVVDLRRLGKPQNVKVRFGKHETFARLVLESSGELNVTSEISENLLQLQNNKGNFVGINDVGTFLDGYVNAFDEGKGRLEIALAENVVVKEYKDNSGKILYFDFAHAQHSRSIDEDTKIADHETNLSQGDLNPLSRPSTGDSGGQKDVAGWPTSIEPLPSKRPQDPNSNQQPDIAGSSTLETTPIEAFPDPNPLENDMLDVQPYELHIKGRLANDVLQLGFETAAKLPAAAIRRGNSVFVALAGDATNVRSSLSEVDNQIKANVRSIKRISNARATVFHLRLNPGAVVDFDRKGQVWTLSFGDYPEMSLSEVRNVPLGVWINKPISKTIDIVDPIVGDTFRVALARDPGVALPATRYVDFQMLMSLQGIAWIDGVNDIEHVATEASFFIGRRAGMRVSDDLISRSGTKAETRSSVGEDLVDTKGGNSSSQGALDRQNSMEDLAKVRKAEFQQPQSTTEKLSQAGAEMDPQSNPDPVANPITANDAVPSVPRGVLAAEGLAHTDNGDAGHDRTLFGLTKLSPALQQAASLTNGVDPIERDLESARAFIRLGLGAEALSVLDRHFSGNTDTDGQSHFSRPANALRAAANFLMERFGEADRQLSSLNDTDDVEAVLWRTAMDSIMERWTINREMALALAEFLELYPAILRNQLGILVAQNAMQAGLADPAYVVLSKIRDDSNLDQASRIEAELLWAEILARDGAVKRALSHIDEVLTTKPTLGQLVDGRFLKTILKEQSALIDKADAIEELLEQKDLWRGHVREPRMLQQLGEFLLHENEVVDGLDQLETAIDRDISGRFGSTIDQKIDQFVMSKLASGEVIDDPLLSLMLLQRYGDVVSGEQERQELFESLAVELANNGFPDVGASLLAENREFVLGGGNNEIRVAVAEKQYQAGNYDGVFSTLPYDGSGDLVEAKARIELGESDKATDLLAENDSLNSQIAQLEAHWAASDLDKIASFADRFKAMENLGDTDPKRLERGLIKIALSLAQQRRYDEMQSFLDWIGSLERGRLSSAWEDVLSARLPTSTALETVLADLENAIPVFASGVDSISAQYDAIN